MEQAETRETTGSAASCRLYVILARDGRSAVIFRRGPSRQVRLLRWWLGSDTIEPGQWLKGRIYVRRCDLSPDGEMLVYFAAKWETPMSTWTAVSRPPFLTALALWPKGDAWGGGGLFLGPNLLGINHDHVNDQATATTGQPWHPLPKQDRMPRGLSVCPVAAWAGRGEDDPIQHERMTRDGWTQVSQGKRGEYGVVSGFSRVYSDPGIYERPSPHKQHQGLRVRRLLRAIGQRDGPWQVEDFEITKSDGTSLRLITNCGWADWLANGDLGFAINGRLYRLPAARALDVVTDPIAGCRLVADLTDMRFEGVKAPEVALSWPRDIGNRMR